MSYVFAVTKRISESNDEKAFDQLQVLREREECVCECENKEKNPELIDFVNYIRLTYPCLCDFDNMSQEEAEEYEEIWGDGPLLNNITGDVFTFSLMAGFLDEPLDFIIEEAIKRGFSVFSYEFHEIWRS